MDTPPLDPANPQAPAQRKSSRGPIGTLIAAAVLFLGKAKWLVAAAKFAKFPTLITMLLSIGVYAQFFGWPFAAGFVLLILVHELGHAAAMRYLGIPGGAPVFIPFVGAVIAMRGRPQDAYDEAFVGAGGPLIGSVGALGCLIAAFAADSPLMAALAETGFLLNLFNLLPVSPLDGGRMAGAISRWLWIPGFALLGALFFVMPSPILVLVMLMGGFTAWRRYKAPVDGYYDIKPSQRLSMGLTYFWLIATLVLGMSVAATELKGLPELELAAWLGAGSHAIGGLLWDRRKRSATARRPIRAPTPTTPTPTATATTTASRSTWAATPPTARTTPTPAAGRTTPTPTTSTAAA